jgi:aromatic ring-opening dioxygenase catalytic subunit (LigB family)
VSIEYACAMGHAPGIVAWAAAAPTDQRERLYGAFAELRRRLDNARLDTLIVLTAEHWANFFLDHMSAFCIGVADQFSGPVEPWLKIDKARVECDQSLARELLEACYARELEPSFAREMQFDHGTMIPLHFLTPGMNIPVVPIVFNTLAPPFPSAARCLALGRIVGEVARGSDKRIGIVATGGMSHDPGERNHGVIDSQFDQRFLEHMKRGDLRALDAYSSEHLAAAGAGAVELLSWIALAGALEDFRGEVLAYEAVKPWATGIGAMAFQVNTVQ